MSGEVRIGRNKGRVIQARPTGRRKLFGAGEKAVFLDWFAGTANLSWSARMAGVHYRTVLRHRMSDPAFRERYDEAEAQSIPRLRAWLMEAGAEDEARIAAALDGEDEPGGNPAPVHLSVEQGLKFLADAEKRLPARRPSTSLGTSGGEDGARQGGRPPTVASNAEVREALIKALRAHGIRVRTERDGGEGDEPGAAGGEVSPAARAAGAPPPPCGWSPSPAKAGEE